MGKRKFVVGGVTINLNEGDTDSMEVLGMVPGGAVARDHHENQNAMREQCPNCDGRGSYHGHCIITKCGCCNGTGMVTTYEDYTVEDVRQDWLLSGGE